MNTSLVIRPYHLQEIISPLPCQEQYTTCNVFDMNRINTNNTLEECLNICVNFQQHRNFPEALEEYSKLEKLFQLDPYLQTLISFEKIKCFTSLRKFDEADDLIQWTLHFISYHFPNDCYLEASIVNLAAFIDFQKQNFLEASNKCDIVLYSYDQTNQDAFKLTGYENFDWMLDITGRSKIEGSRAAVFLKSRCQALPYAGSIQYSKVLAERALSMLHTGKPTEPHLAKKDYQDQHYLRHLLTLEDEVRNPNIVDRLNEVERRLFDCHFGYFRLIA